MENLNTFIATEDGKTPEADSHEQLLPPEFGGLPLKVIYAKLSAFTQANSVGKIVPIIPHTYSRVSNWNMLNESQKTKVLKVWNSRPDEWKLEIIDEYVHCKRMKQLIQTIERSDILGFTEEEKQGLKRECRDLLGGNYSSIKK